MYRSDKSNTLDGINNNTYNLFFINREFQDETNNDKNFLLGAMQQFTKLDDESIEYVIEKTDIFKRKGNMFKVNYNLLNYNFYLLDSVLIENKEELRSEKRIGKCIHKSIGLANSYDGKCKVSIGYIYNNTDKILHSVFIRYDNDEEYVYDYTMNLIMKKDDYIDLFDFNIINEINGNDIKKDKSIILNIEYMSSKFYLCFRDEIIENLDKNSKVLKLED